MSPFQSTVTIFLLGFCALGSITCLKMKAPSCRGQTITWSNEDMNAMADCMMAIVPEVKTEEDSVKVSKAIPKEKIACLGKCIMGKEGLIDVKGMPAKDLFMAKINASMPQEVVQDMDDAIEKCVDEQGKTLDNEDPTCKSYQGLTQCIMMTFVEVCKIKKD